MRRLRIGRLDAILRWFSWGYGFDILSFGVRSYWFLISLFISATLSDESPTTQWTFDVASIMYYALYIHVSHPRTSPQTYSPTRPLIPLIFPLQSPYPNHTIPTAIFHARSVTSVPPFSGKSMGGGILVLISAGHRSLVIAF